MTVKEIIKTAATLIGEEEVFSALDKEASEIQSETLKKIDLLTRLINLVVGELSATYIPLKKEEKIKTSDGKIKYSDLTENAVKILAVYDEYGEKKECAATAEYIMTGDGEFTVVYAYAPPNLGIGDETGYSERDVSTTVLSYGVIAEYCLTQGRFDEATFWRKRYSDGIDCFCLPQNSRTKRRGWL